MTDETDPIIHLKCQRTGRLYRVLSLDMEAKQITLRGLNGTFTETLRPVREFAEMGYERIIGPIDGAIAAE
jgi:hypothetical protein